VDNPPSPSAGGSILEELGRPLGKVGGVNCQGFQPVGQGQGYAGGDKGPRLGKLLRLHRPLAVDLVQQVPLRRGSTQSPTAQWLFGLPVAFWVRRRGSMGSTLL